MAARTAQQQAARQRYRQAHPARVQAQQRAWYQKRKTTETLAERATRLAALRRWRAEKRRTQGAQVRAYERAYRAAHRERLNARHARWMAAHPEVVAAQGRRYRQTHQAHRRALAQAYRVRYGVRDAALKRRAQRELVDWYVAKLLGWKVREVPPDLLAAKRAIVRVKRLVQGREPGG